MRVLGAKMEKVEARHTEMATPHEDERLKSLGRALGYALQSVVIKEQILSFDDVVREYKRVEKVFVKHTDGNAFHVLETKRRVAERILCAATRFEQPFEVCQAAWNEMVAVGFTNSYLRSTMTWFYADCCLLERQFDAGLAVLEPLIADTIRQIEEPTRSDRSVEALKEDLARLEELRDELKAGLRE
jgi:RPA family protein